MNVQLWKLAQARLLLHAKSGADGADRGAIQIGDLPSTAFIHDNMEDQVCVCVCLCVCLLFFSYKISTKLAFAL